MSSDKPIIIMKNLFSYIGDGIQENPYGNIEPLSKAEIEIQKEIHSSYRSDGTDGKEALSLMIELYIERLGLYNNKDFYKNCKTWRKCIERFSFRQLHKHFLNDFILLWKLWNKK